MSNLAVVQAAVSDKDGVTAFGVQSPLSGLGSIGRAGTTTEQVSVQTLRLDTFSAGHRPPTLILVDIEGDNSGLGGRDANDCNILSNPNG